MYWWRESTRSCASTTTAMRSCNRTGIRLLAQRQLRSSRPRLLSVGRHLTSTSCGVLIRSKLHYRTRVLPVPRPPQACENVGVAQRVRELHKAEDVPRGHGGNKHTYCMHIRRKVRVRIRSQSWLPIWPVSHVRWCMPISRNTRASPLVRRVLVCVISLSAQP